MSELFRKVEHDELRSFLAGYDFDNLEIGKLLRIVDDITALTDGKKPIYIIEIDYNDPDDEFLSYMSSMFTATNMTAILVPSKTMKVVGAVVEKGID